AAALHVSTTLVCASEGDAGRDLAALPTRPRESARSPDERLPEGGRRSHRVARRARARERPAASTALREGAILMAKRSRLEREVQRDIELAIGAELDLLLMKNSCGVASYVTDEGKTFKVPYGLGNGSPDLVGILRREVNPRVTTHDGIAFD